MKSAQRPYRAWHSTQKGVSGMNSRRPGGIGFWHDAQTP
jgi:hypothetical protein